MCVFGTVSVDAQNNLQSVQGLTAYDSVGRRIGNVLGFTASPGINDGLGAPVVAFAQDNTTFVLTLSKGRFFGIQFALYYTSTDCTGTGYFFGDLPDNNSNSPTVDTVVFNGVLHVPNSPPQTVSAKSALLDSNPPFCNSQENEILGAKQAKILVNLTSLFTPPFSVR